jgi:hypothetical protein
MSRIRDLASILTTSSALATDAELAALIPSQTSNSGKYLTTNGTALSWGTVSSGTDGATVIAYSFLGMGA